MQNFVTNSVFCFERLSLSSVKLDKKIKTQQENKKSNIETLAGTRILTRDLSHSKRMRNLAPPSQLRVRTVVKLFNSFDAMGRNVKTQSRICGPHISNKFMFSVISLHAWITIFGSFSYLREYVLCLNMVKL